MKVQSYKSSVTFFGPDGLSVSVVDGDTVEVTWSGTDYETGYGVDFTRTIEGIIDFVDADGYLEIKAADATGDIIKDHSEYKCCSISFYEVKEITKKP